MEYTSLFKRIYNNARLRESYHSRKDFTCPNCGAELNTDDDYKTCHVCGTDVSDIVDNIFLGQDEDGPCGDAADDENSPYYTGSYDDFGGYDDYDERDYYDDDDDYDKDEVIYECKELTISKIEAARDSSDFDFVPDSIKSSIIREDLLEDKQLEEDIKETCENNYYSMDYIKSNCCEEIAGRYLDELLAKYNYKTIRDYESTYYAEKYHTVLYEYDSLCTNYLEGKDYQDYTYNYLKSYSPESFNPDGTPNMKRPKVYITEDYTEEKVAKSLFAYYSDLYRRAVYLPIDKMDKISAALYQYLNNYIETVPMDVGKGIYYWQDANNLTISLRNFVKDALLEN